MYSNIVPKLQVKHRVHRMMIQKKNNLYVPHLLVHSVDIKFSIYLIISCYVKIKHKIVSTM